MKKIIIFIFAFILLISLVIAVPSIPNVFFGKITYSGYPGLSLAGYNISASVGGSGLGIIGAVKSGNTYQVIVDPEGETGEIIFYIGGTEASPKAEYEMGEFTELDLIINNPPSETICGNNILEPGEQCDGTDLNGATCANVMGEYWTGNLSCAGSCSFDYTNCIAPYCGDNACNSGESCSSCSKDCGSCSSGSGSGGGGGSSGGGGGSSGGGISYTSNPSSSSGNQETTKSNERETVTINKTLGGFQEPKGLFSKITGAVIGGGTVGILLPVMFILLIILAAIVIYVKRKA